MIQIREARIKDIDWIFEECKSFAKFYGTKADLAGDMNYGMSYLFDLVTLHFVRIAEDEQGQRLGFIAGLITPHHFNPKLTLMTELLWWVPEHFRNTGAGKKLFDAFTEYGKMNADLVTFTLEDNSPVKDEFLLKRGFRFKERTFILEGK